ncbi:MULTISPECIES: acyl-CoA dehydrogenase family protein [Oceanobacillus]|uniref:Acyl-CoA dehydrogenase n=1 Tax=Oceanobacillus kimchii TaxID=746691 RepID=A0ABQ5TJL3_9BACI|nr:MULTISPECIES: acyl-CoA dehydrogenase family protein [Oceanobacillus]MBT2601158.1 acyl-CoA dehydrogenase family protein [Oceanobacillus sp. ISL-74]MBT2652384.1 acyl-CoA dehydrogenase family protein [Oceanobacillus sp. ISL-73]MCT1579044.1 acyl-CoA dehydrogenase family protein [Oceanobacillus kimchii]MCT2137428.1 acyl-CoA dehydrogenase family protein [Oceanobacillus kimchii]OEH53042.1 acyl-CoA dehydrogenase [Oceanobacillus sp. E9]
MSETKEKIFKGGAFLVEDITGEDIITPEDFTDEHKMIAKTTEDFVLGEVVPKIDNLENHEFEHSVDLLKKAGDLGLLGADVPEEYGGLALDKISSSLITEKFSRAGGFSVTHGAHVGIGSLPIVFFGNEVQKEKYLPKLATGELLAAYALTEPSSGSDALGAKTTAKLNDAGTHYILNGEKQWITNSAFADVFVVYAKIDGEHFTAFIVEREYPGVSTGPEEKKMGIKSSSTRTLVLEDAEVPVENLLGEKGRGHVIAFNILNVGRYKLAVGGVGGSKRAIELASKYTNERKQFNTPISSFNLTKEKLATMAAGIYANESSVYRTVGLFEQRMGALTDEQLKDGREVARAIAEYQIECSMTKYMATELLDYVVDEAVQMHGGYGFMQEYEVERAYRDSRINRIFEGTNEINRLLVPGTLLKKALKGELPLLQKAQGLQEELMMMMPEEIGTEALEQEKYLLKNAKKMILLGAGLAAQKYGQKLDREQEILVNLANMVAEVFNMESAILRTEKAISKVGEEKSKQKLLYTEVYVQEAFNRIEAEAKDILVTVEDGDTLRMMLSSLRKLTRHTPINVVQKKREIAARIIEEEKYVI